MFNRGIMLAVAMASASVLPVLAVHPTSMAFPAGPRAEDDGPRRKRVRLGPVRSGRYRSKGPQAKPPKKTNRLRLGQRVRRRHRRAA